MVRFSRLLGKEGGRGLLLLEADSHAGRIVISQVATYSNLLQAMGTTTQGLGLAGGQFLQSPQSVGVFIGNYKAEQWCL